MATPVLSAIEQMVLAFATNQVAAQANVSPTVASAAVTNVVATSGHPILTWLTNGGFAELLQLAVTLAPLVIPAVTASSAS